VPRRKGAATQLRLRWVREPGRRRATAPDGDALRRIGSAARQVRSYALTNAFSAVREAAAVAVPRRRYRQAMARGWSISVAASRCQVWSAPFSEAACCKPIRSARSSRSSRTTSSFPRRSIHGDTALRNRDLNSLRPPSRLRSGAHVDTPASLNVSHDAPLRIDYVMAIKVDMKILQVCCASTSARSMFTSLIK
jgi:hypothetical protein